ncbi:MAG: polysaccharide deacetylase family protein [Myxococcales bacterium]|nr:polysaccharide deacetylase family protein [Myxococcales bacterium]
MLRLALVSALLGAPAGATPPALDADLQPPRAVPSLDRFARGRIEIRPPEAALLALTFDDGPSAATTPLILDALAREGVRATFFVNAHRLGGTSPTAARQREILREQIARGHNVGNHTFDHERLSDLPPAAQEREILDGEAGITRVLGERPYLFRPPYGRMADPAAKLLAERGYTVVLWNISSEDPFLRTPEKVVAKLMEEIRREGGGVVLLHDTHPWTAEALPRFFRALEIENCRRVAAGEVPLLLVELDRFFRSRYGDRAAAETLAARGEADRVARQRISLACGEAKKNADRGGASRAPE